MMKKFLVVTLFALHSSVPFLSSTFSSCNAFAPTTIPRTSIATPFVRPTATLLSTSTTTRLHLSTRSSTATKEAAPSTTTQTAEFLVSSATIDDDVSTAKLLTTIQGKASVIEQEDSTSTTIITDNDTEDDYKKGFATIAFICLLNASLAPVWHAVFAGSNGPPPLFLNAIVSVTAFIGLLAFGPFLDGKVEKSAALAGAESSENGASGGGEWSMNSFRGGMELGLWKGLGTTCHIYGMALTTANHGAFLLQLTTLIVPVVQGLRGAEKIPRQIQLAVALALVGITAFTQAPNGSADDVLTAAQEQQILIGDGLVLLAAAFYSGYDIQTFYWGRKVPRKELVTIKIGFQAVLSCLLCAVAAGGDVMDYLQNSNPDWGIVVPTVLWSGLIVNALATFLQVGGMQSVGPTRAQTIFASQPLWASGLNFVFLGETMGMQGLAGGGAFLAALFLAAAAEAPLPKPAASSATES